MGVILGRKVGMTRSFSTEGTSVPVTVIKAGPCKVVQARTIERDGYKAAVVGFEEVAGSKLHKAQLGAFKKASLAPFKVLREFRDSELAQGTDLDVSQFAVGDTLIIQGISKGHGFTNVIKKWNFKTGRESHGGNCQRKVGSTGMHTWPAHVIKGKKMPGRWGSEKVTIRTVEVIDVMTEDGLLLVKGSLPGIKKGLLSIQKRPAKKAKAA